MVKRQTESSQGGTKVIIAHCRDGRDGHDGIQGIKGDIGPRGAVGPQGDTGPCGHKGDQGNRGHKGYQGDEGAPGLKGESTGGRVVYTRWGHNVCPSTGAELIYSGRTAGSPSTKSGGGRNPVFTTRSHVPDISKS